MSNTETVNVLRYAADLIEEHGWTQGNYYRTPEGLSFGYPEEWKPGCSMCMVGALYIAADDDGILLNAHSVLISYVGSSLPSWNDDPNRTADEVVDALRDVADRLEMEK